MINDKCHRMFGVLPESIGLNLLSSSVNFSLECMKMRKDRFHLSLRSSSTGQVRNVAPWGG